jgi:hypothetical protein
MKYAAYAVLLTCLGATAQKPSANEGNTLTEASLAVAKRVCVARPDADVWVYHERQWDAFPCHRLQPVFDLDKDNSFDALIPLIEEAHTPKSATK